MPKVAKLSKKRWACHKVRRGDDGRHEVVHVVAEIGESAGWETFVAAFDREQDADDLARHLNDEMQQSKPEGTTPFLKELDHER